MLFACSLLRAQNTSSDYSLLDLQEKFTHKNYTEKVLLDFHKKLEPMSFKPELHEYIPGEVVAWSVIDGKFSTQQVYLIENNTLRAVNALPKEDAFLAQLNTFVPRASRFTYSSDSWSFPYIDQKLEDGAYLIKVTVTSFNSQPDFPSDDILTYDLEYITTDFVHFQLLRLKDMHSKEWIEVED